MCGIAGIWHLNGTALPPEKLRRFTDSIYERGPDGSGYELYDNGTLGLGHRRLSILDLSEAGHQPMSYADGRYHITYNGEVFNFGDIRKELQALGYQFRSDTDTEVILSAYIQWGQACLNRFNGMWAFAIWDNQDQHLFIARDRFGIRPLYYTLTADGVFAFNSETRAFKQLDGYRRELDAERAKIQSEGVRFHGYGHTIFKGIVQVLPGHCMTVRRGYEPVQKRWWDIRNHLRTDIPKTLKEQAEEYYQIFRDACRIRMISDVSVGTALSGGLDSSSVYSVVYDLIKEGSLERAPADAQRAFVATFPGLISDERHYAEEAVRYTNGPVVFLDQQYPDLAAQVENDTRLFDGLDNMPITAVSGIYRGMKREGITVSLDGHGVDEMLYGYRDMLYNLFYHFYAAGDRKRADMLKGIIVPSYHPDEQEKALKNLKVMMDATDSPIQRLKQVVKKLIGKPGAVSQGYGLDQRFATLGEPYDFSGMNYADRMVYSETFVDTLPFIFREFDLAGMMNSVEIRMPFMDWRLVTYMFSLPFESKVGGEFNKLVLREAMKGRMAENIRTRKHKIGISSPTEHWFRTDLKPWVLDLFHSADFVSSPIITDRQFGQRLKTAYDNNTLTLAMIRQAWQEINLQIINQTK